MTEELRKLALPERLDISCAVEFKSQLDDCCASLGGVELQADQVTRVDGSGAQLLYAFIRHCRQQGKVVRWAKISAPLHQGFGFLGLLEEMGL